MAQFRVVIDKTEYLTTTVFVEADTIELAEAKALDACYDCEVDWQCYDSDGPSVDFAEREDSDDDSGDGYAYAC